MPQQRALAPRLPVQRAATIPVESWQRAVLAYLLIFVVSFSENIAPAARAHAEHVRLTLLSSTKCSIHSTSRAGYPC